MRDIKFRAWDNENEYMITSLQGVYTALRNRMNITKQDDGYYNNGDLLKPNKGKYTLMQYTGLHDKNGKEIYEGDIVRQVSYKYSNDEYGHKGFYENISKVLYKGRAFQYEWIRTNGIEMPKDFKESFIEVIGNIYDNPGLLEKGAEE